jgi:putative transposase
MSSAEAPDEDRDAYWPHAPMHRHSKHGAFFVTASTYHKEHHFAGPRRLGVLQRGLLKLAREFGWNMEAWAVFSNHYHFVGQPPADEADARSLGRVMQELHERTSAWVNGLDGKPGRRVWHNFWDTHLSFERSYLARLRYVHENAVHHGVVRDATQYPFCSAAWFERTATAGWQRTISTFKIDRVSVAMTTSFIQNGDRTTARLAEQHQGLPRKRRFAHALQSASRHCGDSIASDGGVAVCRCVFWTRSRSAFSISRRRFWTRRSFDG